MNLNVSLTEEQVRYIEAKVESGSYASSSDVVEEALKLLSRQDDLKGRQILWLQDAWKEGMESGDFQPLDIDAIKAEGRMRRIAKD